MGLFGTPLCDGFVVRREMLHEDLWPLVDADCPTISCCDPDTLADACWPTACGASGALQ